MSFEDRYASDRKALFEDMLESDDYDLLVNIHPFLVTRDKLDDQEIAFVKAFIMKHKDLMIHEILSGVKDKHADIFRETLIHAIRARGTGRMLNDRRKVNMFAMDLKEYASKFDKLGSAIFSHVVSLIQVYESIEPALAFEYVASALEPEELLWLVKDRLGNRNLWSRESITQEARGRIVDLTHSIRRHKKQ